jgi:hypothetical protein
MPACCVIDGIREIPHPDEETSKRSSRRTSLTGSSAGVTGWCYGLCVDPIGSQPWLADGVEPDAEFMLSPTRRVPSRAPIRRGASNSSHRMAVWREIVMRVARHSPALGAAAADPDIRPGLPLERIVEIFSAHARQQVAPDFALVDERCRGGCGNLGFGRGIDG